MVLASPFRGMDRQFRLTKIALDDNETYTVSNSIFKWTEFRGVADQE
jgi:hypothetical protein